MVSGPGLSDCISGTDPLRDNLPLRVGADQSSSDVSLQSSLSSSNSLELGMIFRLQSARPLDASVEAKRTAAIVNELSDEIRKVLRVGIL